MDALHDETHFGPRERSRARVAAYGVDNGFPVSSENVRPAPYPRCFRQTHIDRQVPCRALAPFASDQTRKLKSPVRLFSITVGSRNRMTASRAWLCDLLSTSHRLPRCPIIIPKPPLSELKNNCRVRSLRLTFLFVFGARPRCWSPECAWFDR